LSDLIISGIGIRWYEEETGDNEILSPATTVALPGSTYYASQTIGSCESDRIPIEIVADCYSPKGTIFPFVNTADDDYNELFVTTAKLYAMPPTTIFDKIGYIRKQIPIQTVKVSLYECGVDFIEGAPKHPGMMGRTDNPGKPILWGKIINEELISIGTPSSITVSGVGDCPDSHIGKYIFTNIAPGDYVLEIARKGFLTRYGKITVEGDNYLGHREILGGDINGDLMITEKDLSTIRTKITNYGSSLYNAAYDLRGTKGVSSGDVSIISFNLGAYSDIYEEAENLMGL